MCWCLGRYDDLWTHSRQQQLERQQKQIQETRELQVKAMVRKMRQDNLNNVKCLIVLDAPNIAMRHGIKDPLFDPSPPLKQNTNLE